MKNIIYSMMIALSLTSLSYAGQCSSGVCSAPVRPVRKIVNVTKDIVIAPVRAVVAFAVPNSCCDTVATNSCDCGCSSSNKTVTKYQPLRRRLVNRSTTVSCCE